MDKIGVIADDLTGSTTVGVLLARSGISSVAYLGEDIYKSEKFQSIILNSDSRASTNDEAKKIIRTAVEKLRGEGVNNFSKRIDTTLRGNIGAEIEAILENLDPKTIAIMVPAMPESNRVLIGGHSIIEGVPLSITPVSADVKTPIKKSDCLSLLKDQTTLQVGHVSLDSVIDGIDSIKYSLIKNKSDGAKIIVIDAMTSKDIKKIAKAVDSLKWDILPVDPGPFTTKLYVEKGYSKKRMTRKSLCENRKQKKTLVVVGSATPTTKEQIKYLATLDNVQHLSISPEEIIQLGRQRNLEIKRKSKEANQLLSKEDTEVLILETSVTSGRLKLREKEKELCIKKGEGSININTGLAQIVKTVMDNNSHIINGLYATGGDTMYYTLQYLGAKGIDLIDYVVPQTDLGLILGGRYEDLVIVGKGGLTGDKDTVQHIVNKINNKPITMH